MIDTLEWILIQQLSWAMFGFGLVLGALVILSKKKEVTPNEKANRIRKR